MDLDASVSSISEIACSSERLLRGRANWSVRRIYFAGRRVTAIGDGGEVLLVRAKQRIAAMPAAGPKARIGNAQGQPSDFSRSGTIWIVTPVNRNPSEVCRVRAVPTA